MIKFLPNLAQRTWCAALARAFLIPDPNNYFRRWCSSAFSRDFCPVAIPHFPTQVARNQQGPR